MDTNKIVQNLMTLLDVKSSSSNETKIFQDLKQKELEDAFEYWFSQSTMVFGEVGKIEKTHSLKEAGIDLCFNLINSDYRIGIQIKTFGDIEDKDFSRNVLFQKSQSLKHKLSKYVLVMCGDMNAPNQAQKIQGMNSELLQHYDNYVITLSPEKALTIYHAYKTNQHPLKLVFLEYSQAVLLCEGIAETLNNETRKVDISINIKNINFKDGVKRPHKLKTYFAFDKNDKEKLKIIDDMKNMNITDEVIKLESKSFQKFSVSGDNISDDNIKESKILSWVEKPNRRLFSISTISSDNQSMQHHDQVMDVQRNNNIVTFNPKEMNEPLTFSLKLDINTFQWNFSFNIKFANYDILDIFNKIVFLYSLNNATFLRIFIPEDNITENIPMLKSPNFIFDPKLLGLIRVLYILSRSTGNKIIIPDQEIDNENVIDRLLNEAYMLLYITDTRTRIIPINNINTKINLRKNLALKMLEDYSNNLICNDLILKTHYSYNLLGNEITILNTHLNLYKLKPITKYDQIKDSINENVEIELAWKQEVESQSPN